MKVIPNHILKLMRPEDRAPLGKSAMLSSEAQAACDTRSEKQLQTLCENYARQRDIPFFRQRMDRKSNMKKGAPDAFVCAKGRFLAFEFKVGGNQITSDQANCIHDIRKSGGSAYVVREFVEFKDALNFHLFAAPETQTHNANSTAPESQTSGAENLIWVCDDCGERRDTLSNGGITRRETGEHYGKCSKCDDEFATFHRQSYVEGLTK